MTPPSRPTRSRSRASTAPASEPRHEVETAWASSSRPATGWSCRPTCGCPCRAAGRRRRPRFPAILEMIPYGKDNWRRNADIARGTYLAQRGYVLCRVDVRGTGSSGGVALDEYTEDETRDGYDAVEWLAAQPWCTGAVGMWGISYGGFTSIQVAKLRPPHLRAIVPVQATDDRYLTDVHYIGGCVTASELSQYAVSQVAMNAMPPDPALRGATWRDGLARAARRDAAVAVRVAPPAARRPVLAPGLPRAGLRRDRRRDPQRRRLDGLVRGCGAADAGAPARPHRGRSSGNWVHGLPASATPGPNLDELHELVRFFDRWLKGDAERRRRRAADRLVRARLRRARAVPGRACRGAGGRRRPTRIPRSSRASGCSPAGSCRSSGGWSAAGRPIGGAGRGSLPPSRRRSGPVRRCRGAPVARQTGWPATSAPTRASARPTRPSRSARRHRDARRARRWSCIWPSRRRSPRPSSG